MLTSQLQLAQPTGMQHFPHVRSGMGIPQAMARQKRRQSFLIRWIAPLIAGPALTAGALLWLWGNAEHNDLVVTRPTILDFGRAPVPPAPKQPLKADPPPPVAVAGNIQEARDTGMPPLPPPNSFDALLSRVTVLDAARFRTIRDRQALIVHLAGIDGVAFSDICEGSAGRWNCGARARADLARLIGPRSVGCVGFTPKSEDGESRADCWVGNKNLSAFMVSRGWAVPSNPADPLLAPYATRAKTEKLGRYGDGRLQPPDPDPNGK